MEYLLENFDWLESKLSEFGEDDTLIFDCPGQLELYTHVPCVPRIVRLLQNHLGMKLCTTFLVDAVSIHEPSKFVAGALAGLSAMLQLPVPHVTILSKSDTVADAEELEKFLDEGSAALFVKDRNALANAEPDRTPNLPYERLHAAITGVIDDHAMLSFVPFTVKDDECAAHVLAFCDHLTQYSENAEVNIPKDIDDA